MLFVDSDWLLPDSTTLAWRKYLLEAETTYKKPALAILSNVEPSRSLAKR